MEAGILLRLWAPGLIGYAVGASMYGATLCQSICYVIWFPDDHWLTKALVLSIFLGDTVHMIGSTLFTWRLLVSCHGDHSWSCGHKLSLGAYLMVWVTYMTFAVQGFYCRRIWTISGRNKPLTLIIFIATFCGLILGTWYSIDVSLVGTIDYMFTSPLITFYAGANTVCDLLITGAIFKYLWKSGFRRQRTVIQDLALVCINTGALTCTVAIVTGIVNYAQKRIYLVAGVGIVFPRCYANSALAVLNARKTIRERDANIYELSTLQVTPR